MNKRFLFNLGTFFSIIFAPWWFSFGLIVLGFVLFDGFYMGLVWAGLIDMLYGHFSIWSDIFQSYLFVAFGIFLATLILKPHMRFYGNS